MGRKLQNLVLACIGLGAIFLLAGTILYWVTKAEGVSADQPMSLSKQIDCFYAAYACLVPVFTLIAFLRRAHALYAVAFAIYVTVFLGLFFQVDFLRYVLQTSYMLPSVGARNFAGIILILTGMSVSLLAVLTHFKPKTMPTIVSALVAALFIIGGAVCAYADRNSLQSGSFALGVNPSTSVQIFLMGVWALVAGLTRSLGISVGLAVLCLAGLADNFSLLVRFFMENPSSAGLWHDNVFGAGLSIAFAARIGWVAFCALWFSGHSIHDNLKHAKKSHDYTILA